MRRLLFAALTAAVVGASGCAKNERGVPDVKIQPSIRSRVTGLHFDTGDRIGVTIALDSGPYAENTLMTYDGAAFTAQGFKWYNDANTKSTLMAYYPYSEAGAPAEFTVAADQTQGCAPSDLLVAVKKEVTPVASPVGMIFCHVLSQLTIVVTNNSDTQVTEVSVGGFIPTAEVDFSAPSAAAKSGVATAEIKAFEVIPDASYRAVLVPQQGELTVTVVTADGKSRSKTLSQALLEGGKRYDVSVIVTNIDIDVSLSGDIGDWEEGGSLDGGGGGNQGGSSDTELTYAGETYRTVAVGDQTWMAENLRYVPDRALLNNGVWYPSRNDVAESDAAYVREKGMLYNFATAVGGLSALAESPVRGICPPGWHIPSAEEMQQLIAGAAYGADFLCCAGMWNAQTNRYGSESKGSMMSATSADGGSTVSCMSFVAGGGTPSVVTISAASGVSLRCVKDGE